MVGNMSAKDQSLIAGVMEGFVDEVPANPFVSFCVFCNKGVIKEEMVYEKGKVFHKDCYLKHGSSYPSVNQELISESTNAKVQLIQLKNLKIRMAGGSISSGKPKTKTKKKTKRKAKRKPKRRVAKKKKTSTRRKKTKKKSKRKSSKRRVVKRKTSTKRRKTSRKTKRRVTRKTKRKTRRRR